MPGLNSLPQDRKIISTILDTAWSPVAKLRLLSAGISPNHLLENTDGIVGQKACIACGNCIDACPVVLRERDDIDLQIHRTSLHLETIVDNSCLRCYACIKACPQVDRSLKLYADSHRFTEWLVHWWMAIAYVLTAATGILLNHFKNDWSAQFATLITAGHKIGGIMWLLSPFLFYFFDRYHFNRTWEAIMSLSKKDVVWWLDFIKSVFSKAQRPFEGEYNPGQKTWYVLILGAMLVLGITGVVRWGWESQLAAPVLKAIIIGHIIAALFIDISVMYHFGRKYLMRVVRRTNRIRRNSICFYQQQQSSSQDNNQGRSKTPFTLEGSKTKVSS